MVRALLMVVLLTSGPGVAFDGLGWLIPSKQTVVGLLILGCNSLMSAAADCLNGTSDGYANEYGYSNCTNSTSFDCTDPYYLNDKEIETYTWFQIASGIFAIVVISNNFIVAWCFYEKAQRDQGNFLEVELDDAKRENELLLRDKELIEKARERLLEKIGERNHAD